MQLMGLCLTLDYGVGGYALFVCLFVACGFFLSFVVDISALLSLSLFVVGLRHLAIDCLPLLYWNRR